MHAYQLFAPSIESLRGVEIDPPRPGPGEVLVRMRGASLNYLDLMVADGRFAPPSYPFVPGTDGAGEVAEVGPGVSGWASGDRVVPHLMVDWIAGRVSAAGVARLRGVTLPGSLADYAVVPAQALVRTPAFLSDVEAATLPIAATTAWNGIRKGGIGPGSTVLLLGTGGVSLFALQFAKAAGARVIITSSSDRKLERARTLGADETINYRTTPNWDAAVLDLTHGRGADLVMETAGAATFARSLQAAAHDGTIFVVGLLGGAEVTMPIVPVLLKALRILGNNTGSIENFRDAVAAIEACHIRPVVDRAFDFADAPLAYATLREASHFGKLSIRIGDRA